MKKPRTFPRAEALEVHPTAYLTKARAFFSAAERLLNPNDAFDAPVNFLHGHAMELAFKAFLRTKLKDCVTSTLTSRCFLIRHGRTIRSGNLLLSSHRTSKHTAANIRPIRRRNDRPSSSESHTTLA